VHAFGLQHIVSKCNMMATYGLADQSRHDEWDVRESAMQALCKVVKNDGEDGVDLAMTDVAVEVRNAVCVCVCVC